MKRAWMGVALCLFAVAAHAQTPSGDAILEKVDLNQTSNTKVSVWEMTIRGRRGNRTMKAKSWVQGTDCAFTEYP